MEVIPISCYDDSCFSIPVKYCGEWVAKVVQKDPELEKECDSNIFYRVSFEKKPNWVYIPEWNMYRCNISAGRIYKPLF